MSASICYGLYCLKYDKGIKEIMLSAVTYIMAAGVGFFAAICFITGFHPMSYIEYTLGVSGYQSWYYINSAGSVYAVKDLFIKPNLSVLLALGISVLNVCRMFRAKEHRIGLRSIAAAHIFLALSIASLVYQINSTGMKRTYLMIPLSCFAAAYIIEWLVWLIDRISIARKYYSVFSKVVIGGSAALGLACAVLLLAANNAAKGQKPLLFPTYESVGAVYNQGLAGYIPADMDYSMKQAEGFLEGGKLFSTYASVIETSRGEFQPSGYDYIIHVLGNKARQNYMESFNSGGFKYVQTLKLGYWENIWVIPANWFFFRELYRYYEPVYEDGNNIYWRKSNTDNRLPPEMASGQIGIQHISDNEYLLTVSAESGFNGVCDVYLTDVRTAFKKGFLTTGDFKKEIDILLDNSGMVLRNGLSPGSYFSIKDCDAVNIPITVAGGTGTATITAVPNNGNTTLTIGAVKIDGFYAGVFCPKAAK
jgi:hypothetical protein